MMGCSLREAHSNATSRCSATRSQSQLASAPRALARRAYIHTPPKSAPSTERAAHSGWLAMETKTVRIIYHGTLALDRSIADVRHPTLHASGALARACAPRTKSPCVYIHVYRAHPLVSRSWAAMRPGCTTFSSHYIPHVALARGLDARPATIDLFEPDGMTPAPE